MARYLGIDYGTKKIGIALSDEGGRIAFPKVVIENNWDTVAQYLSELVEKERVCTIVVGLPLGLDGTETAMTAKARAFALKLKNEFHPPVVFEKEVLSTKAVRPNTTTKEMIDASSAALILQGYLDKVNVV
ncbi:MAG: hypothetical protein A3C80_02385 [Candidatus Ryanbacteria bacterium RIFCSPHIGHO2_02_FULL_45_43]|uniref:Putative pre-16S rRNA nuclease n=1 Tax=Candidatus Ryanbacteria bacterium RIFCSPHIGHO2_01_45_13 TaxID=1802112 RepID=A0A1G2FXK0_9BACT|nr:MAG: hypothetical protein A2718_00815 [Candidatus Ryanbacteria bacterium RIFCSPHIGHO2_01_FULL_44_130]OGZ42452.1 MAG: hypothetical protein A2W41_03660 [Candidatus Ryanbacteria bacterium RIFCSPHIGHO2_01_45_13]OGZ48469.1 MAG: hypothetical protein A3C80_02385 [Candidatus Ryanbacteria bacterium RIFCSPHIGHO2_02_FULL_45_43]OGZ50334.1 MAG: hypothetical protein A3E55_00285 [Candidatus Ryanbacteria bacterium RIFCSPHIGHO2_12_FULL_44_20]OGZ51673.1 MAG: hypothetical protein A3A17_02735 [Candidatus Ryanba